MTLAQKIEIRQIEELQDIHKLINVQQQIWGFDQLNLTAPELIIVHSKLGGVVLGAFDEAGGMVGFVYSFPAEKDGEIIQWSHMLAVLPEFRRRGLGKRLKWRQREETLKKGMRLCCWTFDPLQTINCKFNIVGLGAITGEYVVDAYGLRNGNFDAGLPTDRFVARWELNESRVLDCIDDRPQRTAARLEKPPMALCLRDSQAFPIPSGLDSSIDEPLVAVTVPGGINKLRKVDLEASMRWREATREIFTVYFKRGYSLVDILSPEESKSSAFIYILTRGRP